MSWENNLKDGIRQVIADSHASYFLRHAVANSDDVDYAVLEFYERLIIPLVNNGKLVPVDVDSDVPTGTVYLINPHQMLHGLAEDSPLLKEFPFLNEWQFPENGHDYGDGPPSGSIEQGFKP